MKSILNAYSELFSDEDDRPKAIWVKTRKGRGYLKYDSASHGSPHKSKCCTCNSSKTNEI